MNVPAFRDKLVTSLSACPAIQAIGQTGDLNAPLIPGKSDIDLFVLCEAVPGQAERRALYQALADETESLSMQVCDCRDWGIGDVLVCGGVEIMPMYFTAQHMQRDLDELLGGGRIAKEDGFSPIGDGAIYNAGALKAGATGKATFTLYAGEGLKPGVNELEVSGIFTTADGEQTEFSQKFFVQVAYSAVSSNAPNLVITSATAPNAKAGEKASLTVVVENRGKGTAENAVLTVSGLSASGIMLQDTLDTFTVGTLKAGAKKTLVIPLKISKECAAYTPLELTLKHSASADAAAQTIYLSVTPSEDSPTGDDDVSLPRVIVDTYTIDPETVQAGGNFLFTFTLKNTSKTLAITNFKITISSADGIFTPVSGSNTFYTESIGPGATSEYSIQLNAKAAAEQKS